jgi:hypothetical protein
MMKLNFSLYIIQCHDGLIIWGLCLSLNLYGKELQAVAALTFAGIRSHGLIEKLP